MTIKYVTIADIQPSAEFFEVLCPTPKSTPILEPSTVVCNSFPIEGRYHRGAKAWVDISVGTNHWRKKLSLCHDNENGRDLASLIDAHVIRRSDTSYNFNRWFHTQEDALAWCNMVKSGEFDQVEDQNFFDTYN